MNRYEIAFLESTVGQSWLVQLSQTTITPANHLQLVSRLRRELPHDLVPALVETTLLRQKAQEKFSRAGAMYFTRPALEQASSEAVAVYRAGRYAAAGLTPIVDMGCGIGADAIALAAAAHVIGIDQDEIRLRLARLNLRAYGRAAAFQPLRADLNELPPPAAAAFFFDPARRDEFGRRIYDPAYYEPPLTLLDAWRAVVAHGAVKLGPGVDFARLPADGELEVISLDGGVKEAVLWFGRLQSGPRRRATLLPAGDSLTDELPAVAPTAQPVQAYLYEPDGAVIRAGLVAQLAGRLEATFIDPQIAYLTADHLQPTPFARAFAVTDVFPFQLKRLRGYLRQRRIGQVVIKKRGSALEPDELRGQLRLRGDKTATLFLTRVGDDPLVIVGQPAAAAP